ncbi:MAG: sensor histidine kinase, partial [Bacteroidota bacterium]
AISITKFNYFWYYFLYVFLGAFIVFCDLGLGYHYLWPGSSYAQKISIFLILNLYLIFGTLFVRSYFNTRNVFKKIDQAFVVIMIVAGGVIPFTLLMPFIDDILYSHIISTSVNILYIATCVLFFCLFFMSYFSSQKIFPGIFLFGFSLHGLSIIIGNLQDVGLVRAGSLSGYLMSIGHPLTIHLQIAFMLGMLLEMAVIFYLAIKRFARLYKQNNLSLQNLATQKQKTMNAMVFGIEKERERWSHELHDGLGVKLSLLKQELQMLSGHFAQPRKAENKLDSIIDELDTAHQDLRNISHNIMPKSLHKLGLRSAIEELLYRLRLVDNSLEVNFFPHADLDRIPRFSQQQMYHIVQELLNNMIKHSQATEINLQFVQHQEQMMITMEDNGQGFDVSKAYRNGIGLKNIKNRVSVLGGKFMVDSAPGRGTLISVELPLESLLEKDLTRVDDPVDT